MTFQNLRRYLFVASIGCISFMIGFLVMHAFLKYIIGRGSGKLIIMTFAFCVTFIGIVPVLFYVRKSMKSLYLACIIALLFVGSLLIVHACIPLYFKIWFHLGIGSHWDSFFVERIHVHIYDALNYVVLALSFGLLSLSVLWKRKKYIPLITGLVFLGLMFSMAFPNILEIKNALIHETIQRGIFGGVLSVIVLQFYWQYTINYYKIIKEKLKK
jgi:hypothetical protein